MDFPEFKFGYIPLIASVAHLSSWATAGQIVVGAMIFVLIAVIVVPFVKFWLYKRRNLLYLHNFDHLPNWSTAVEKRDNPPVFFKFISNEPFVVINSMELATQLDTVVKEDKLHTNKSVAAALYPLCQNAYRDMGKNIKGEIDVAVLLNKLNEQKVLPLWTGIVQKEISELCKGWEKNMKVLGGVNIVRWNFNSQSNLNNICRDIVFGNRAILVRDKASGKGLFHHLDEYQKEMENYLQETQMGYWGSSVMQTLNLDDQYKKLKRHAEIVRRLVREFVTYFWDPELIGSSESLARTLMEVYPDARTDYSQGNAVINLLTLSLFNVRTTLRTTFSCCMHQLATRGELRKKLEDEIRGCDKKNLPELEKKIERYVKEFLRLEPLAPCLPPLELKKGITLKGNIKLVAGTNVIFSPMLAANDSKQWKDPFSFIERDDDSLDNYVKLLSHGHFNTLPMAIQATKTLIFELLRNYDFTLSSKQVVQKVYRYFDNQFKDDFSITIVFAEDFDAKVEKESIREEVEEEEKED